MGNDFFTPHTPSTPALSRDSIRFLVDPLNRFYRYPILKKLAFGMKDSCIHPNHITVLHTIVGVFAAGLIYREEYLLAVIAYELRTLLDALGGRLVKTQNRSTSMGRTLEMIGDGITFNALMVVGAMRLIQDFRNYNPALIVFGVFMFAIVTVHCGTVYQLMKRKLGSIIRKEVDVVETEWLQQYQLIKNHRAGLLVRFGFLVDSLTIQFISSEWYKKVFKRRNAPDWQDRALRDAAIMNELACITRKREFIRAVKFTALISDDNIYSVVSLCLLICMIFPGQIFPHVHPVLIAFSVGLAYGIFVLALGMHLLQDFLHGVYRE